MKSDEFMIMSLQEVSDYLMKRRCELGEDSVGVELKGRDDDTGEVMVLTVSLRRDDK